MIRPLAIRDAPVLAGLHARHFPGSIFLPFGRPFLEALYREIARPGTGIGFVYATEAGIQAYIAAATDSARFFRGLVKREWPRLLWRFLRRPALAGSGFKLFRDQLLYSRYTRLPGVRAEYLFIVVRRRYRGKGIPRELILRVKEEMIDRRIRQAKVVILRSNRRIGNILLEVGCFRPRRFFRLWNQDYLLLRGDFT